MLSLSWHFHKEGIGWEKGRNSLCGCRIKDNFILELMR